MGGVEKIFGDMAHLQNAGNKSGYERVSYNEFSDFGALCGKFSAEGQKKERREFLTAQSLATRSH